MEMSICSKMMILSFTFGFPLPCHLQLSLSDQKHSLEKAQCVQVVKPNQWICSKLDLNASFPDSPAMSFLFVCWHNKYQKYKSVELGDQLGWCQISSNYRDEKDGLAHHVVCWCVDVGIWCPGVDVRFADMGTRKMGWRTLLASSGLCCCRQGPPLAKPGSGLGSYEAYWGPFWVLWNFVWGPKRALCWPKRQDSPLAKTWSS